ncbi:hypothetical protein NP493_181g04024 [Ridgeia piscesae]|uniref:Uncharacterized protein n=1 Tax=Ridgeia piscesae TaxID=27915 RepID=A0AAD9P2K6_RIDPI|nr:hypothetical protein NP493_181g04024 [Ridgeia piscesae]
MRFPDGTDQAEIRCIGRGDWYPNIGTCKARRCSALPYVDNTRVVGAYTCDVHAKATFHCLQGSYFEDGTAQKTISCRSDLEWEDIEGCRVRRCPKLVIRNGHVTESGVEYNGIVTARCHAGYSFKDGTTVVVVQCLERGWNWTQVDCIAIMCTRRPEITKVLFPIAIFRASHVGDVDRFGDVIRYNCKRGERFMDGTTTKWIKCNASGLWNDTDSDNCASARCPPLPSIPGVKPVRRLALNGTTTEFRCDPGKVFHDGSASQLVYCDGTAWNGSATKCEPLHCGEIRPSEYGMVNWTETVFGSVVRHSCALGYTFDAGRTVDVRCNETGDWSPETGQCRLVDCGLPPVVFYSSRVANIVTTFGSTVTIKCFSGYWLRKGVFSAAINCSDQGTWQPVLGHCRVVKCRAFAKWNGMVANTTKRTARTVVNVMCGNARMFTDGQTVKVATCGDQGAWKPEVPDCVDRVKSAKFLAPLREATRAQVIGAAAIALVVALGVAMVAADVTNLKRSTTTRKKKKKMSRRKRRN